MMVKIANKCKKLDSGQKKSDLAALLLLFFDKNKVNNNSKKIINKDLTDEAEDLKVKTIKNEIKQNRLSGKWFYLASSHNDCAIDHKPYQGKMYYDNKAPLDIQNYAKNHGMMSIQEVMDGPAWFITRPNCRHFFEAVTAEEVQNNSVSALKKRYRTHSKEGNREFSTPIKQAIEEYEDRLRMLKALYAKYPTTELRRKIEKTEFLLRKWKKSM